MNKNVFKPTGLKVIGAHFYQHSVLSGLSVIRPRPYQGIVLSGLNVIGAQCYRVIMTQCYQGSM